MTPPHISVYELQKNLNQHLHDIYFGITRVMDRRDITRWLDDLLTGSYLGWDLLNFNCCLQSSEYTKHLKKHLRYKRKHPKYKDPIHWVTQVRRKSFRKMVERSIIGNLFILHWITLNS